MANGSAGEQAIRGFTQGLQGGVGLGLQIQEQRTKVDARLAEIQEEKFSRGFKLSKAASEFQASGTRAGRQRAFQLANQAAEAFGLPPSDEPFDDTKDFSEVFKEAQSAIKAFEGKTVAGGNRELLMESLNDSYNMARDILTPAEQKELKTGVKEELVGAEQGREQAFLGQVARLPQLEEAGAITTEQRTDAEIRGLEGAGKEGEKLLVERIKSQIASTPKPADDKETFTRASSLRKEFTTLAKTFRDVRDSFARVESSSEDPSAAGDLALIFNYMKMLDPASVVRESEFANAAATGSFGERFKAAGAKLLEGERLSDVMRADFVDRATRLSGRQNAQHKQREETFRGLAKRAKVNPRDVVIDLSDPRIEGEVQGRIIVNPQTGERMQEVNGKWQKI